MNRMKVFISLTAIIYSILFVSPGCTKSDIFSADGYYSGSFSYQGQTKFDALIINGNDYEEVPSGGAMNQKFPCLTKGTYRIKGNEITFSPGVMPDCLCYECLLNGKYTLSQSDNTIKFQKGSGDNLQVYDMTLIESSR
jgi:hypothetical protein